MANLRRTQASLIYKVCVILLLGLKDSVDGLVQDNIIFAINAGGPFHVDDNGIRYQEDPLGEDGIASDFGRRLNIQHVSESDQILYQTERYTVADSFGYNIPVTKDGDYVLVLKFSEVYFRAVRGKVFDVRLNEEHTVIENLDIFFYVGYATALDIAVPFAVVKNVKQLILENGENSPIYGRNIPLDFLKVSSLPA